MGEDLRPPPSLSDGLAIDALEVADRDVAVTGAILIGKTNLDQFATGLVGTRSPFTYGTAQRTPAWSRR